MATDLDRVLRELLTEQTVQELAASCVGDAELSRWWTEPVNYSFGTPTTVGAVRLRGETVDGRDWSLFVKVIQSFRHWPLIDTLPSPAREDAMASALWRFEAEVYAAAADVTEALPDGLRLPAVHRVADLPDDRIVMVLEDIAVGAVRWDTQRFATAAELLGRASARLTRFDALPVQFRTPAGPLVTFYETYLVPLVLPTLQSYELWKHPLMSTADDTLRADLDELANRAPAVLDRLAQLPQVMVHGDASPQNLLIPQADPDTFVAIDWSLGGLEPAGEDLAQLQLGLAHAGELELEQLAVLRPVLVDAFSNGLRAEGLDCREEDIAYAMDGGLLFRSAFTSLPLDRLQEPITEELADLFANRLTLTRHLTDHCLSDLPAHP
jgi:hypothetical protein